jgi:hypothetical protein
MGCFVVGIRRKVQDCVLNYYRLQYPSLDGNYMGHWPSFSAQPHVAAQPHITVHPHVAVWPYVSVWPHKLSPISDDDCLVTWAEVLTRNIFEGADEKVDLVPVTE